MDSQQERHLGVDILRIAKALETIASNLPSERERAELAALTGLLPVAVSKDTAEDISVAVNNLIDAFLQARKAE